MNLINLPLTVLLIGFALIVVAIAFPRVLSSPYALLRNIGRSVARGTGPALFTALFFIMVTPVALVRKIFARDPLTRAFDPSLPSYFQKHEARTPEHMKKPF